MTKIFNHTPSIFSIENEGQLVDLAIEIFHHQYTHASIYHNYVNRLKIAPDSIKSLEKIPFLPIRFFKSHAVLGDYAKSQFTFQSSGTTGKNTSKHEIADLSVYETSFRKGFEIRYGSPDSYCFLALLPSYLERESSSLVYMMQDLIRSTEHLGSGFYLHNHPDLYQKLLSNEKHGIQTVLIGVTFALLEFASNFPLQLKSTIVMETGGMKGRREEMTRAEVHDFLKNAFGLENIHSEYGMTELLSQAYSTGNGLFIPPPWMRFFCRETSDPLTVTKSGRGGINILDLANIHSCSFIATDDLGVVYVDKSFEITGRYDHSEARGCNLMVI